MERFHSFVFVAGLGCFGIAFLLSMVFPWMSLRSYHGMDYQTLEQLAAVPSAEFVQLAEDFPEAFEAAYGQVAPSSYAKALRRGFRLGTKGEWWRDLAVDARQLQRLVCGNAGRMEDFEFREVFRVVEDGELKQCPELREALWGTIDSFSVDDKRLLLKFMTGIDRLPIPGTEVVRVEMPFMVYGLDEHRKNLQKMPQAHTCDNVLELPNYWESLLQVYGEGDMGRDELKRKLAEIMQTKFRCAIEMSEGFGLDSAFSD